MDPFRLGASGLGRERHCPGTGQSTPGSKEEDGIGSLRRAQQAQSWGALNVALLADDQCTAERGLCASVRLETAV
jgi:hypothetical protein